MEKEFDYYRILKIDYVAYFELWVMILPWIFYPLVFLPSSKISVLHVTIVIAIISLIVFVLFLRRMKYLKNLCFQGLDVIGRVTSTRANRRGGSLVDLTYVYQTENYQMINELRTSPFYNYSFREGDELPVRLNPKKPTEAVIRDVYFSVDKDRTPFIVPKLLESKTMKKLYEKVLLILPNKFVFADVWSSDRIDTNLSNQKFIDTIMEFGRNNYSLDEKRNRIRLGNNFILKINTAKFADRDVFSLKFYRCYHRFYLVYIITAVIMSFVVQFTFHGTKTGFFALIIFMLPISFIWLGYETVRGIKKAKPIDYSKEVERVYHEILDAVRKKEEQIT